MPDLIQYSRFIESSYKRILIANGNVLLHQLLNVKDAEEYGFPGKTTFEFYTVRIQAGLNTSYWRPGDIITFEPNYANDDANVDLIGTDGDYTLHWKILGVVDSLEAGREWVIIDREHTEGTTTIGGSATSKAKIYGYDDYGDTWNDIVGTWSEPTEGRAPIWGETLDFSLNANEFFTLEIPQSSNWTAET